MMRTGSEYGAPIKAPHTAGPVPHAWIDALPFALFLPLAWMILHSPLQINHDCAYVLECARILTEGGLPYVDFIDINPPLIFYMNMAPVYVSKATGLLLPQAFSLFVAGQLLVSSVLLFSLFRMRELNLKPAARAALLAGWIVSSLFVYATGDFGQRDYLVIIMVFPFVIVRVIRYYGDRVRPAPSMVIGIMTGIGLSLKPYFFLLVLIPEAIALVRTRRARVLVAPEMLSACAFTLSYALHFLFLPERVHAELFGRWMPFFMHYYGTINLNLFHYMFTQPAVIAGSVSLVFGAVLAFVIVRRRGISSLRLEMLTGLFIGSFLSYWMQQKGYSYHALPAKISFVMLSLFAALWLYEEIMHRREQVRARKLWAVSASILILLGLFTLTVRAFIADRSYVTYESFRMYRQAIRSYSAQEDRVLFINTVLFPAYPTLIQTGRRSASRYLTSFPLAGFYYGSAETGTFPYRDRRAMPDEERRFLSELGSDIETMKPALVFIHDGEHCSAMPEGFRMHDYFLHSGFIQEEMRDYRAKEHVGDFVLYVRALPDQAFALHDSTRQQISHD